MSTWRLDCAKRLESSPPPGHRVAIDAQNPSSPGALPDFHVKSFAITFFAFLLILAACSAADGNDAARPTGFERDTEMKHEPCDGSAAGNERIDVDGDGWPNIIKVMKGGREICRILDLNLDRAIDAYVYYDESGFERRREFDFDRDGRVDEIITLHGGAVVLKERETNFDNQLDTWDYYESGKLVKRERDSDGDGMVDQWWTFNDPTDVRCAAVAFDRNYDGQPDPSGVLDVCAESRQRGYVPPTVFSAKPATSSSAARPKSSAKAASSTSEPPPPPAPSSSQASPP
ncbi:MAG TPA: hypothetical protein PK156_20695 [Polyangium sp.]|nr:hypothetical protein [Polyangium sp.]